MEEQWKPYDDVYEVSDQAANWREMTSPDLPRRYHPQGIDAGSRGCRDRSGVGPPVRQLRTGIRGKR